MSMYKKPGANWPCPSRHEDVRLHTESSTVRRTFSSLDCPLSRDGNGKEEITRHKSFTARGKMYNCYNNHVKY